MKKILEARKRKAQPIKLKLDFDMNQDGAPDSYTEKSKHSNKKQSNETPDFYSQNFNDEGTNVRPLHTPNKDGKKFKKSKATGDNHLTYGNDFEVADDRKPKVGHVGWSGDDHLFDTIEEVSSRLVNEETYNNETIFSVVRKVSLEILKEEVVNENKKYLLKKELN
jgi:hypothetical protein|tara:strand:+ start:5611 stop:6108 length:498 start_codon:yes stop_codon:yes gene_type:complete